MTQVKDIMKNCAVAIRPETTLAEAARILAGQKVDGAPVVTADLAIVGMISELHLLDVVFDLAVRDAPVSDYMTRHLVLLHPDDSLARAAQLFALHAFRRLPVAEDGKLLGIVTRWDLMEHALRSTDVLTEPLVDLVPELAPMS